MKKAGHKNRENQKHAPGVWDTKSPTGVGLGEKFCKANFDHSDGKPWATVVFNSANSTRALRTGHVSTSAFRGRSSTSRASHRSAATSTTSTRTSAFSRRSTRRTRPVSRARFSRRSTSPGSRRRTTRASRTTRTGLAPSTSCPRPQSASTSTSTTSSRGTTSSSTPAS